MENNVQLIYPKTTKNEKKVAVEKDVKKLIMISNTELVVEAPETLSYGHIKRR